MCCHQACASVLELRTERRAATAAEPAWGCHAGAAGLRTVPGQLLLLAAGGAQQAPDPALLLGLLPRDEPKTGRPPRRSWLLLVLLLRNRAVLETLTTSGGRLGAGQLLRGGPAEPADCPKLLPGVGVLLGGASRGQRGSPLLLLLLGEDLLLLLLSLLWRS